MSELDIKALEANFEGWRKERVAQLPVSKAFERFAVEQILKDADLSDDEIASGLLGGEDDGGIDGMYFFINRVIILDETSIPEPAISAQLYIMQAKLESGFGETAVQKMESFTRDLLNYSTPVESLTHLNSAVRDSIARFRNVYGSILGSQHSLNITFGYATKSDKEPNPKVRNRIESLSKFVKNTLSAAVVDSNAGVHKDCSLRRERLQENE